MWELFISLDSGGDEGLWRRPWFAWWLRPRTGARVIHVASAADWVDLVAEVPLRRSDDLLVANWRTLATRVDGVHLHPQAVAAMDGFRFTCGESPAVTTPVYFGVESTLWLNWVFSGWGRVERDCGD